MLEPGSTLWERYRFQEEYTAFALMRKPMSGYGKS
jgi:hypothetical protein